MKKIIRKILSKIYPGFPVMWENYKILAFQHGQLKSITSGMAIDATGQPIPWYTYPAIEYLKSIDFQSCDVFEFGSGNSSIYWSKRAKIVTSVEDNKDWCDIVSKKKTSNMNLLYRGKKEEYIHALADQGRNFDVIIVDGNHRKECVIEAIKFVKADGMILLDNSDRLIEKECGEILRRNHYIQIDFSGFGPINGYCWTTSIFLKDANFFKNNYAGPNPIGGIGN